MNRKHKNCGYTRNVQRLEQKHGFCSSYDNASIPSAKITYRKPGLEIRTSLQPGLHSSILSASLMKPLADPWVPCVQLCEPVRQHETERTMILQHSSILAIYNARSLQLQMLDLAVTEIGACSCRGV
ncbi:hypothetical protein M5K25_009491 [Dendrobium thyrsiflorum]|uniref:Uncharacterized protein n=1 Tax=Dendrobium thyrsiflorum TaxID=117978 RepID=A0ABD0VCW8_DENTH